MNAGLEIAQQFAKLQIAVGWRACQSGGPREDCVSAACYFMPGMNDSPSRDEIDLYVSHGVDIDAVMRAAVELCGVSNPGTLHPITGLLFPKEQWVKNGFIVEDGPFGPLVSIPRTIAT